MWCQTFAKINWNCLLYVLQIFYILHTMFQILVVLMHSILYVPCFMTWHSGVAKYLLYMCIWNDWKHWKLKECKMEKEWCITREMNGNTSLTFWFEKYDFAISSLKVTSLTLSCLSSDYGFRKENTIIEWIKIKSTKVSFRKP